ncbi:MAG: PucR family transcriptional regulator ligand-binding domain-containing protein [Tissierellia bacterium]|nr:PucR family transcriptional regulator ligand-binding domain-containing protein [Tissierellia bacterium]
MKVKDVFTLNNDFKSFKLLAGECGVENEIKSVDIMEVPDGVYWVKPGDFIITTGYTLTKNDTTIDNIVQMMIARGAAALGIKLGRYIDEIPEKIIQYANENCFPIIYVPIAASYASVVRPILNKLVSDDNYDFHILKQIRQEMRRLTIHNYNITALTNMLADYIGQDVLIFWENNFNLVNRNNVIRTNKISRISNVIKDNKTKLYTESEFLTINDNEKKYYIFKINSYNEILAFLCLEIDIDKELTKTDIEIIREITPIISIYLLSNSNKSLYYKSLDEFYFSILENNYANDDLKLQEEASYRNVEINKSRYIWIIESSINEPNSLNRFTKKIVSIMELYDTVFFYKNTNKRIIFIVENKKLQSNIKLLKPFFERTVEELKKSFKGEDFKIGISKICNSLKYLNYAFEEASFAIKIGTKLKENEIVYLYDDFIIYHLLSEISDNPTLSKIYKNTIVRIKKNDSESNSELLKTLQKLVQCDFSISQTAEKLFIHRNTLYKRINKINSLLDSDIDKSEYRLLLQIALKLNEILE